MNLFIWDRSEFLKNYGPGTIVVLAADLDQAQRIAADHFVRWIRKHHDYWFVSADSLEVDDWFREEYEAALAKFQADIAKAPVVDTNVLFIPGSN